MTSRNLLGGALTVNLRLCLRSSALVLRDTVAEACRVVPAAPPDRLVGLDEAVVAAADDLVAWLVLAFLRAARYFSVMKDMIAIIWWAGRADGG
jgi:hypothetical protein